MLLEGYGNITTTQLLLIICLIFISINVSAYSSYIRKQNNVTVLMIIIAIITHIERTHGFFLINC